MIYSDVIQAGLILPAKSKYTMRDVNKLITNSLFSPVQGRTLDLETAVFIVKCSAVYHKTRWSKTIDTILNKLPVF